MSFIALEKNRAVALAVHPKDLSLVPGGDVEPTLRVKRQVPDVFSLWIEEDRRREVGIEVSLALVGGRGYRLLAGLGGTLDLVHLTIGRSSGIKDATRVHYQRLDFEFRWREHHARLAFRRHAINPRRRAGRREHVALAVGGHGPNIGRWRRVYRLKSRRKFQRAAARDSHAFGGAFFEIVEARLLPDACAFGEQALRTG